MKRIVLKMSENGVFDYKFVYLCCICNVCCEQKCAMVPTIVFENKQGFLS